MIILKQHSDMSLVFHRLEYWASGSVPNYPRINQEVFKLRLELSMLLSSLISKLDIRQ